MPLIELANDLNITHFQTAVVVIVVLAHATTGAWVFFSLNVEPFRNLINQPPVLSLKTQHVLAGCPCLCFFLPHIFCLVSLHPQLVMLWWEAVKWEIMFRGVSVGYCPVVTPSTQTTTIGLGSTCIEYTGTNTLQRAHARTHARTHTHTHTHSHKYPVLVYLKNV